MPSLGLHLHYYLHHGYVRQRDAGMHMKRLAMHVRSAQNIIHIKETSIIHIIETGIIHLI